MGPPSSLTTVARRLALIAVTLLIESGLAMAQEKPAISVAAVVIAEPATETPLPIQVGPPDAIPRQSFLRIRGLPSAVALTEGHSVAPGSWAVPLQALAGLKIAAPVGSSGRSEITLTLVAIDGAPIVETKTVLVLTAASALVQGKADLTPKPPRAVASLGAGGVPLPAPPPRAPAARSQESAPPAEIPQETSERARRHMARGEEQLAAGDIAAARLLFQKAAELGWAAGALALAASYDAAELSKLKVRGVTPDPALARSWYEKARALGAAEADERLRRLGER